MTLERLMSFIDTVIHQDTGTCLEPNLCLTRGTHLERDPHVSREGAFSSFTRYVARALNSILMYQGKGVSSAPPDTWQCLRTRVSRLTGSRLFKEGPRHHLEVSVTSTKLPRDTPEID